MIKGNHIYLKKYCLVNECLLDVMLSLTIQKHHNVSTSLTLLSNSLVPSFARELSLGCHSLEMIDIDLIKSRTGASAQSIIQTVTYKAIFVFHNLKIYANFEI